MGVSLSSLFLSNPKTITSSLRTVGAISFLTGASLIPLLLLLGEITGERTPIRINSVPEEKCSFRFILSVSTILGSLLHLCYMYKQSLSVLKHAKLWKERMITKSSTMLGLRQSDEEVKEAMADLRAIDVDILTLGQYLQVQSSNRAGALFVHKLMRESRCT
ncbi:hypothetical protein COCNU_14G009180 [Cocos nucifera]|uniref:Uncharacterized protein n=1 Tax=Cocos nucifera TaxID=13894 RepID=A0A8K0IVU7_COCNU|nr:hypothetical protein COCNU_14G009180 [Cocos nucifera]